MHAAPPLKFHTADTLFLILCFSASIKERFGVMRDALNATGRPIIFAIDDWGVTNTWKYGTEVETHC